MHPEKLLYPALFHDGQAYFLERSDTHTGSYFGGPIEETITGIQHGPDKIHHIATLNGHSFEPLWHVIGVFQLHLLYGMCFDGCHMKYRTSVAGVEVLEMTPSTSAANWPYPDYPTYLPYFPLRLQQHSPCSLEEFLAMSCQPIEVASSETLVLIPPSPVLACLFGGHQATVRTRRLYFDATL